MAKPRVLHSNQRTGSEVSSNSMKELGLAGRIPVPLFVSPSACETPVIVVYCKLPRLPLDLPIVLPTPPHRQGDAVSLSLRSGERRFWSHAGGCWKVQKCRLWGGWADDRGYLEGRTRILWTYISVLILQCNGNGKFRSINEIRSSRVDGARAAMWRVDVFCRRCGKG